MLAGHPLLLAGNLGLAGTGMLISSCATDGGSAAYGLRISTFQGFLVESCDEHGNKVTSQTPTRVQQRNSIPPPSLVQDTAVATLFTSMRIPHTMNAGDECW
jgi:hypothetical protein